MRLNNPRAFLVSSALLTVIGGTDARAATASTTLQVTATVIATCTVTAAPLAFGNYTAVVLDSSTTVSVTCSLSTPFNIGLDVGVGLGATIATRRMTNGTNTLQYTLSSNSARTTNIGQTVGTDTILSTGTGTTVATTIYGRIPAGQYVPAGSYTDTITATITY